MSNAGERFFDVETGFRRRLVLHETLFDDLHLGIGWNLAISMGHTHSHEHRQKALDAELAAGVGKVVTAISRRPIFLIELQQRLNAANIRVGPTMAPIWRIKASVAP